MQMSGGGGGKSNKNNLIEKFGCFADRAKQVNIIHIIVNNNHTYTGINPGYARTNPSSEPHSVYTSNSSISSAFGARSSNTIPCPGSRCSAKASWSLLRQRELTLLNSQSRSVRRKTE